jgi:hypothetical protein
VQQDRYCSSCGQELRPEDQFCPNCGRPVHATAQVPTPAADVPVPPLPQQDEVIAEPSRTTEQPAAPSPQPQQRLQWIWSQYKWKIFLFLGSVIVANLLFAVTDPVTKGGSLAESVGFVIGYTLGGGMNTLLYFVPAWLALGGLVYLVARLSGTKPHFFQAVFNWWVTLAVTIPILLFGLLSLFYF